MEEIKHVEDLWISFSGDAGYCHYKKTGRGLVIKWEGSVVTAVDCEHEICRYSHVCKLYKRHPVGFRQAFPQTTSSESFD